MEITQLSDGLELLEEPHDRVQGELGRLEDHQAFQALQGVCAQPGLEVASAKLGYVQHLGQSQVKTT